MSSVLPSPSSSVGLPQEARITRGHSCVLCRRRKIKCDGQRPCRNCQKSRAGCMAAEIAPARKRKRKTEDIVARLRRAEEALNKAGLKIADGDEYAGVGDASESGGTVLMETGKRKVTVDSERRIEDGKLIVERGQSRYFETSVWGNLSAEVREDSIHLLPHSSEDETADEISTISDYGSIIFGRLLVSNSLKSIHPPPVQVFRLWQVFLNNVNPMTKVVHAPTVQELILQAMCDLDTVSASTEALMFAIYYSAIVSIDDLTCQSILDESRVTSLAKYSTATQQALVNTKLLRTSNLIVLQALTLYLLSIREFTDHDTHWVLCGIATKIGQRMGLHRESASASLSVLDAEIRRRLWWQILTLEAQSSFLSGSAIPTAVPSYRPSRLLNVNDSDLSPCMRELPVEQAAITEMLFCCIQYEMGRFMYQHIFEGADSTSAAPDRAEQLKLKLRAVDDLENLLEQRFNRYCDLSVPLHYLAHMVVRAGLSKMRLRVYAPSRSSNTPPQPQAQKDAAFTISLKILEIDNEAHPSVGQVKLKGFMWHVREFFQLETFVYTLSELRIRTTGAQVDLAWRLVEAIYLHHKEILRETKNNLWFAVGNLCLKAWEQRVKGLRSQHGGTHLIIPVCVRELYDQRGIKGRPCGASGAQEVAVVEFSNEMVLPLMQNGSELSTQWGDTTLPSTYVPFDTIDTGVMNWEYWQTLFDDYGVPLFE